MLFALIIILLGVVFLLRNLGVITTHIWSVLWPSIIILVGFWLLYKRYEWHIKKNKWVEKVWKIIGKIT